MILSEKEILKMKSYLFSFVFRQTKATAQYLPKFKQTKNIFIYYNTKCEHMRKCIYEYNIAKQSTGRNTKQVRKRGEEKKEQLLPLLSNLSFFSFHFTFTQSPVCVPIAKHVYMRYCVKQRRTDEHNNI